MDCNIEGQLVKYYGHESLLENRAKKIIAWVKINLKDPEFIEKDTTFVCILISMNYVLSKEENTKRELLELLKLIFDEEDIIKIDKYLLPHYNNAFLMGKRNRDPSKLDIQDALITAVNMWI